MRRLPFVICIILLISYNFTQAKPRNVLLFDVELTKTVNSTTPGQNSNVTFTLTVFNNSGTDALNVQVKDILPSGLVFVSSDGSYSPTSGLWIIGSIVANETKTLNITATVTGAIGTTVTNYAQIQTHLGNDIDSTPGNNSQNEDDDDSVSLTIGAPTGDADISINKTVNNSNPNPNGSITYTITVSNNGPDNLTTLAVFDDLPTSSVFTYVSHSGAGATYSGGNITWNVGALNNGQSKTLTVTGNALQDHQNCAVIQSASLPDSNGSNNEACVNVDVNDPPPHHQ